MQLSEFQDTLAATLLPGPGGAPEAPPWLAAMQAQPGFAVYRNTVMKGCIDALQANYPTVTLLVGEEWLRATAALHVQHHPPTDGRLVQYGEAFADFLAHFEPAQALPYLPAVARWDRRWTESHLAADAPCLSADWLAAQPPEALPSLSLRPHPAARWAWDDGVPAYTLWQRHRDHQPLDDDSLPWGGDGGLITRPQGAVQWCALPRAGVALLDALHAGTPLETATEQALAADPGADLSALWALLLHAGALQTPATNSTD